MTRDPDDDALSWAGEDDPTLEGAGPKTPESGLAPGWKPVGGPGKIAGPSEATPEPEAQTEAEDAAAGSSVALVVLGILGGVYLLYTIGWALTAGRMPNSAADLVGSFMFTLGLWLAVLAPAGWFALVFWQTRGRTLRRILLLVLGALVLIPLPFILGTGGA
ncbi:hypothetical protein [Microterricola viridarii]|uniref:DNA polymerase III subunit gamma/tau n=1 Tax=Microterricola viridarii TaxID=412690 RepID=A0A1H1SAD8_9MICO|nr:hypothetical protein [Microterricola viridarii]SDS44945.1 hypothetical protein SAMN04489834_1502 [Microterricola viridarii]